MAEVLILPGMDGTGTLHSELVAELNSLGVGARSVSYPVAESLGYAHLAELVRVQLPADRPYVLLGESFSGPVALLVAASNPKGLIGLVLSTTFARAPVSFLGWAARLTRLAPTRLPSPLISWFLLGRWATRDLVQRVQSAMATVQPAVLRARAAAAMGADVTRALPSISVPALVLRAKNDRLLVLAPHTELADQLPTATQVDLDGPHLLLQAQPRSSAQAIAKFVRGIGV
jgi:pimeloyl-ACP methyl ester carboxylesterase